MNLIVTLAILLLLINTNTYAQISGTVFRDFNGNGVKDNSATFNEAFVSGITVLVTLANGTKVSTTTNTSGAFSFTAIQIPSTTQVRIEFSGLEAGDYSALRGSGNGTNVQFVTAPSAIVSFAISYPKWYSGVTNPWIATNRFTAGLASATGANQSGTFPNLMVLRHATSGDQTAITTTAANQYTGSVFGLTYQKETRSVFMAAFMKRLYSFGPGGVGGIYTSSVNQTTGVPSNPSVFVDLSTIGITVGADPHAGLPNTPTTASNDAASWPLVGKRGIGAIDLSEDGKNLWVVNMNPNGASTLPTLHRIFINNPAVVPTAGNVTTWNIPTPTLTGATTNFRPMAIKLWKGRIFVGGVCIKEVTANQAIADTAGMRGVVYEFNETSGTFTTVLSFPLTYKRPYIDNNENQRFRTHYWGPWQNSTTATIILYDALSGNSTNGFPCGSQPMLSNIEFDVNGDMLIGLRDRWGDQMGWNNYLPTGTTLYNPIATAEILRAGNCSASTWTMESNAAVCSGLSSGGNNLPGLTGYTPNTNNVGPGGGLYYFDTKPPTFNHQFRSNGGLAVFAGSNTLTHTAIDPDNIFNTGGIMHLYNNTLSGNNAGTYRGGNGGGARLYNDVSGTSGKSGGMGDCELLTDAEPIQIGNRIWLDTNGDGIQDANETTAGVATGTTVTLRSPGLDGIYGNADDQTWTTTTDAAGNYFFSTLSSADNRKPSAWTGIGNTLLPGYDYRIEVSTPIGVRVTKSGAAANTLDNIDNDAIANGNNAYVTFNTGNTNHNFDFGFKPQAALGDRIWRDDNKNGVQDAGEPGLASVTVMLYRNGADLLPGTADDVVISATTTDAYGNYFFDNLTPTDQTNATTIGTTSYNIRVTPPANYSFSTQTNTTDDNNTTGTSTTGSDVNPLGVSYSINLSAGESNANIDAGLVIQLPIATNSIGDRVWLDNGAGGGTAGNGTADGTEPGVSGVTVTLFDDATGNIVAITTTDANGNYLFNNLPASTNYKVGFSAPGGTVLSPGGTLSLGNATTNSDPNPTTGLTTTINTGAAGTQITGVDAGLTNDINGAIGDFVWNDLNKNGIQDAGEPGIPGVQMQLYGPGADNLPGGGDDVLIATTTTNAFGFYVFSNLTPAKYFIVATQPAGYVVSPKDVTAGNAAGDVKDNDFANGAAPYAGKLVSTVYTLPSTAGGLTRDMTVDLGISNSTLNLNSLGDKVWNDLNENGLDDGGETGVPNVTVRLLNAAGVAVNNPATGKPYVTATDANGNYKFVDLADGNYVVEFANLPAGYIFTTQDASGTGAPGSATDGANDSDARKSTGRTLSIDLDAASLLTGQNFIKVDAGVSQGVPFGTASLGNRVWYDINNNGLQDAGELGVANVRVELLDGTGTAIDSDPNTAGVQSYVVFTNALGDYSFTGLPAGDYTIRYSNLPAGYTSSAANAGTNDGLDADANFAGLSVTATTTATTGIYSLQTGEDNLTVALGIVPAAGTNRLGNFVWNDLNADGLQTAGEPGVAGVSVHLYTNGVDGIPGTTDDVLTAVTVTDSLGRYGFVGLANGNYNVEFANFPAGFKLTAKDAAGFTAANGSDADEATGRSNTIALTGSTNNQDIDAGLQNTRSALGNYVWEDTNGDGIQDATEAGISGMTVTLFAADGTTILASAITDAAGKYFFQNVNPGTYVLGFSTVPANLSFTKQNSPGDNGNNTNSDADPVTGKTVVITLTAEETDLTIDAGLKPDNFASVGDFVWNDLDKDGVQDVNEPGVSGILVTLFNSGIDGLPNTADDVVVGSAITDGNGKYLISKIQGGNNFTIVFSNLPSSAIFTTQTSNVSTTDATLGSDASTINGKTAAFNLAAGQYLPTVDAGIQKASVLPVAITSFTAVPKDDKVGLEWFVSLQVNVVKYEIEHSINGRDFSNIQTVSANNNISFTYNGLHANPILGLNYYRIKTIEKNGNISYSEIRKVTFGKVIGLAIFPNPTVDFINISFSQSMINKSCTVSFIAADGKLLMKKRINNLQQTESFNLTKFTGGTYLVRMETDEGITSKKIQLIK